MKPVRVLIVDDSATMRGLIAATLSRDPGMTVVGQAADPLAAREAKPETLALRPLIVRVPAAAVGGVLSMAQCGRVPAAPWGGVLSMARWLGPR